MAPLVIVTLANKIWLWLCLLISRFWLYFALVLLLFFPLLQVGGFFGLFCFFLLFFFYGPHQAAVPSVGAWSLLLLICHSPSRTLMSSTPVSYSFEWWLKGTLTTSFHVIHRTKLPIAKANKKDKGSNSVTFLFASLSSFFFFFLIFFPLFSAPSIVGGQNSWPFFQITCQVLLIVSSLANPLATHLSAG